MHRTQPRFRLIRFRTMSTSGDSENKLLSDLRVTELKQELEKRNLDKNGIKIILVDRLEKAIKAEGHDAATFMFNVSEAMPEKTEKETTPSEEAIAETEETVDENEEAEAVDEVGEDEEEDESALQVEEAVEEDEDAQMADEEVTQEEETEIQENEETVEHPTEEVVEKPAEEKEECKVIEQVDAETDVPAVAESHVEENGNSAPTSTPIVAVEAPEVQELEDPLNEPMETETAKPVDVPDKDTAVSASNTFVKKEDVAVKLVVEEAKEREEDLIPKSIWVRGLPQNTKAAELKAHFMQYGKVARAKIFTTKKANPTASCFGYVTFTEAPSADKAVKSADKTTWKGCQLSVDKGDSSHIPQNKAVVAAAMPARKPAPKSDAPTTTNGASTSRINDKKSTGASTDVTKKPAANEKKIQDAKKDDRRPATGRDSKPNNRNDPKTSVTSRPREERRDSDRTKDGRTIREPARRDSRRTISSAAPPRRFGIARGRDSRVMVGRVTRPGVSSGGPPRRPEANSSSWDRQEMMDMLKRQQEEHRRREHELEMERERERLKFEREKIEREKLELQLQVAIQQQQLEAMSTSRRATDFAVPVLPSNNSSSKNRGGDVRSGHSQSSRDREIRESRTSRDARARNSTNTDSRRDDSRNRGDSRHTPSSSAARSNERSSARGGGSSTRGKDHRSDDRDRRRVESYSKPSATSSSSRHGGSSSYTHGLSSDRSAAYSSRDVSSIGGLGSALYSSSSTRESYAAGSGTRDTFGSTSAGFSGVLPSGWSSGAALSAQWTAPPSSGTTIRQGDWHSASTFSGNSNVNSYEKYPRRY